MPEFNFALSDSEMRETIDYIFDLGGYVQKDDFFSDLDRYIFSKVEFHNFYDSERSFKIYIFHKESFVSPMPTFSFMRNGKKMYSAYDRIGGPAMILLFFDRVSKGFCFYYPAYYYDNVNYEKFKPNQYFIDFYKALFKFVRKKSLMVKYGKEKIYCGREYLHQVREGTAKFEIKEEFKAAIMEQMKDKILKENKK